MNVLLTGYSGFLGRYLARALKARGHRVRVLLHRHTVSRRDFQREADEVFWGSMNDVAVLGEALRDVRVVIHSAWSSGNETGSINIDGAMSLFEASVDAGVAAFLHISSVAVYGLQRKNDLPIHETVPLAHPEEREFGYVAAKSEIERRLFSVQRGKMKLGVLRPGPIIDESKGPAKKLVRLFGRTYAIGFGNGRNRMPYVHVTDVVDAAMRWLTSGEDGQVFNVTPSRCLPVRAWHVAWGEANDLRLKPVFLRPPLLRALAFAGSIAKRLLGRPGKVDVRYAVASAIRDLDYSNEAIREALRWSDAETSRITALGGRAAESTEP